MKYYIFKDGTLREVSEHTRVSAGNVVYGNSADKMDLKPVKLKCTQYQVWEETNSGPDAYSLRFTPSLY